MFTKIKIYLYAFLSSVLIGFLAYIRYINSKRKTQKEEIDKLKKEIVIEREVLKERSRRERFEEAQQVRVNEVNEHLQELNSETEKRGDIDEKNNNDDSDFVSISV